MKHHLLSLILGTGFLLSGAEGRTWTSADGSQTFEGELHSYDAASGKVSVSLPNGKRMTFLQDKLSAEDIAWLKRNGGRPAGSRPTLAVADLDGVAGKVFDLNPDGSFRFLKQDVQIDPETGKGQAWFSAYAGKDVEIVQWEDRKNLAGLKNPVIAVFTGFDDANAKALKDANRFGDALRVVQMVGSEDTELEARALTLELETVVALADLDRAAELALDERPDPQTRLAAAELLMTGCRRQSFQARRPGPSGHTSMLNPARKRLMSSIIIRTELYRSSCRFARAFRQMALNSRGIPRLGARLPGGTGVVFLT